MFTKYTSNYWDFSNLNNSVRLISTNAFFYAVTRENINIFIYFFAFIFLFVNCYFYFYLFIYFILFYFILFYFIFLRSKSEKRVALK